MKLIVNNYEVDKWDTAFLAMSWFFFVVSVCDWNLRGMGTEILLFSLFLQNVLLKSDKFHLENKLEALSGNVQETE